MIKKKTFNDPIHGGGLPGEVQQEPGSTLEEFPATGRGWTR